MDAVPFPILMAARGTPWEMAACHWRQKVADNTGREEDAFSLFFLEKQGANSGTGLRSQANPIAWRGEAANNREALRCHAVETGNPNTFIRLQAKCLSIISIAKMQNPLVICKPPC